MLEGSYKRSYKKSHMKLAGLLIVIPALLCLGGAIVSPVSASNAPDDLDQIRQPNGEAKGYCKDKNKDKMKEKCEQEISVEHVETELTQYSVFQDPELCPDLEPANGELDVFSTQLGKSTLMTVRLPGPVSEDVFFNVATTNFNAVDLNKGSIFVPPSVGFQSSVMVTVPAGSVQSDPFWVHGKEISPADVNITQIVTEDTTIFFASKNVPVNVWELDAIVDYNDLNGDDICYDDTYSDTGSSPPLVAGSAKTTCGEVPDAVVADGATRLLVRLRSSMAGQACFRANPLAIADQRDPGTTDPTNSDVIPSDSEFADPYWTFGTYIAPNQYAELGAGHDSSIDRKIKIEVAFTPAQVLTTTRANTTAIQKEITIQRPPVLLVHGLWSSSDAWARGFKNPSPTEGWTVKAVDYSAGSGGVIRNNSAIIAKSVQEIIGKLRGKIPNTAITKIDIISHSMGGLTVRDYVTQPSFQNSNNFYQGDVRKFLTITTPHSGSQLANMLINLHENYPHDPNQPDSMEKAEQRLIGDGPADFHDGAVCDLAEGSEGLDDLTAPSSNILGTQITANGGSVGKLHFPLSLLVRSFADVDTTPYYFRDSPNIQPNDGIVSVTSQEAGMLQNINIGSFVHTSALWGDAVTEDLTTVLPEILALLDDGDGKLGSDWLDITTARDGVPTVGRGASIDGANYINQCSSGGPLLQAP